MKNKISDLRNHLFETLEALKDEEKPMDIARAKAVSDVAQVIINSAKVEIEFLEATGEIDEMQSAGFFDGLRLEDGGASQSGGLKALPGARQA